MDRASTSDSSREAGARAIVERFRAEHAAEDQEVIDLGPYLPAVGDEQRLAALRALVVADLERCWRHGVEVLIDRYAERYPSWARRAQPRS